MLQFTLSAVDFSWGDVVKTNINQKDVDSIIKNYVDEKYPNRVKNYHDNLHKQKQDMIKSVENITFIDNNLMWQDTSTNTDLKLNRLELKVYCRKLNFANRKDWRVPLFSEMISLVDYTKTNPSNLDKIKYINPTKYWTSSSSTLEKNKKWFVDFKYGTSGVASDLVRHNIRCVRDLSMKEGEY